MYSVIEESREIIVPAISRSRGDIREYEWLRLNVAQSGTPEYQGRYKNFWTMYPARLSETFYQKYFGALQSTPVSLSNLCQVLWDASARPNGRQSLQFSFATKLLHMLQPELPIYDSRIAWFYFFPEPSRDWPLERRIETFVGFYEFLIDEYSRIIRKGLLAKSIAAFRERFKPDNHTDEKIIDWLIWQFVTLANAGGLIDSKIAYL